VASDLALTYGVALALDVEVADCWPVEAWLSRHLTRHLGVRFEVRAFWTLVDGQSRALCVDGGCLFAFSGSGLWQGELGGGLSFAI
jgi:hypothetical protein